MNDLSLMEKFADPKLIDSLSMGEKATGSLVTALMGMTVTFIVLTLIWGMIALLTKTMDKTAQKKEPVAEPVVAATKNEAVTEVVVDKNQDEALVAVITAAIAASLSKPADLIEVRKIVRIGDHVPSWRKRAKEEQLNSRW